MSYLMKEMEMSGYEGNVDDYIQSRIDSAKTQVQIDQEAVDALKQTYMNSGMDEETATVFAEYYSQLKNGQYRMRMVRGMYLELTVNLNYI